MNKLLLVLLAVCLVSAHAFVKRDAPAATDQETLVNDFKNTMESISKQIEEVVNKNLNPDELKNNLNKVTEEFSKVVDSVKKGIEASKQ